MKNKKFIWLVIIIAVIGAFAYAMLHGKNSPAVSNNTPIDNTPSINRPATLPREIDLGNMTYTIDNQQITLVNGIFEEQIPGSAITPTIKLSDYTATGQINGAPGAAAILVGAPGGSGTFYYLAAVMVKNDRFEATNSILLGDRIKVESLMMLDNGTIKVTILDRKLGEPFSAEPSVQKDLQFTVEDGVLAAL